MSIPFNTARLLEALQKKFDAAEDTIVRLNRTVSLLKELQKETATKLVESETKRDANYQRVIELQAENNRLVEELKLRDEKSEAHAQSWAKGVPEFRDRFHEPY